MPEPMRPQPSTPTFLIAIRDSLRENRADCMSNKPRPQVILLVFVSLPNDSASEMLYPLLPVFLTVVLGATPFDVGLIEGAADAIASILQYFAGSWSDRLTRRRPLISSGYALAAGSR